MSLPICRRSLSRLMSAAFSASSRSRRRSAMRFCTASIFAARSAGVSSFLGIGFGGRVAGSSMSSSSWCSMSQFTQASRSAPAPALRSALRLRTSLKPISRRSLPTPCVSSVSSSSMAASPPSLASPESPVSAASDMLMAMAAWSSSSSAKISGGLLPASGGQPSGPQTSIFASPLSIGVVAGAASSQGFGFAGAAKRLSLAARASSADAVAPPPPRVAPLPPKAWNMEPWSSCTMRWTSGALAPRTSPLTVPSTKIFVVG
mmetsp:Transcript_16621/g.51048  ORF Transcript_16621/g.51048 Transcript_16621/m.51048 type:complete len:261 (-) Transcript_16621:328-1110(-)